MTIRMERGGRLQSYTIKRFNEDGDRTLILTLLTKHNSFRLVLSAEQQYRLGADLLRGREKKRTKRRPRFDAPPVVESSEDLIPGTDIFGNRVWLDPAKL